MDDVVTLFTETRTQDNYGVWRTIRTARQVYAKVNSATRQEFFEGGRNGLNPEYRFDVFVGDYDGEELCEYRSKAYSIYRTYHVPGTDYLELYVQRKGGTNGQTA